MKKAIHEARIAYENLEVPVGCVIVDPNGKIVSKSHNTRQATKNPLNHAEVIAIKKATKKLNQWMLDDLTLYVTIEPCIMCAGLLMQTRIKRVVFGAKQPKFGVFGSIMDINSPEFKFNHHFEVSEGICAEEISQMMKEFFQMIREKNKEN